MRNLKIQMHDTQKMGVNEMILKNGGRSKVINAIGAGFELTTGILTLAGGLCATPALGPAAILGDVAGVGLITDATHRLATLNSI